MTYLIRYAIAESNFMKALILRHFVAYGIPNLNSLQFNMSKKDKEEYMKYTLDTDFSSLNGPKAANWMMDFQDMIEDAFADSSSHTRLLGNLLILEPYMHTLRQGLADQGRTVPVILQKAIDPLWDYLEEKKEVSDFQDFANNLYAATLDYNVGEEITEEQEEFSRNFVDIPWGKTCEWQILTWLSTLLMEVVATCGGRLDFEEFEEYEQEIDFSEMDEMLNMLADAGIELIGMPLSESKAADVMNAWERVSQTPLFRQVVERIQNGLKAALSAVPEQYPALREEYRRYTILPEEYAAKLLEL